MMLKSDKLLLLGLALLLLLPIKGNSRTFDAFSASDPSDEQSEGNFDANSDQRSSEDSDQNVNVDGSTSASEEEEEDDSVAPADKVDLLVQKKHHGDIVQLWDESELDGNMRNALKSNAFNRWTTLRDTDGKYYIPYVITGQFSANERQIIQRAMDAIDRNSCIRYKPRRSEPDYADIQNRKDEGCYTTVGRLRGRQVVMLETGWTKSCGAGCQMRFPGCVDHATVVHELMHKIGLWHEQMRYDRDRYLRIRYENIVPGFKSQFDKISERQSTTYNLPYDYNSVMQYGKNSGARQRNLTTMETIDPKYQNAIGNAKDASTMDYQKICSIYQCNRCLSRAFTPLRASTMVEIINGTSPPNADGTNNSGSMADSADECQPLNDDCDRGIQPGHSLYALYCCPKCSECKPKEFCSVIDAESQKSLYQTFCCGRCKK